MKSKNLIQIIIILVIFGLGVGTGLYGHSHDNESTLDTEQERQGGGYSFINPLIECEIQSLGSQQKYIPFEKSLRERIEIEAIEKNPDIRLSLYFRNLRNGPWFGVDENAEYAPASLMKLPIAISYLKWSETDPSVWGRVLTGIHDTQNIQSVIPGKHITEGRGYTIDELIRHALVYSDNDANKTLISNISDENIFRVFRELSLPIITELEEGKNDYISVKEYASFFRILYNASYLSRNSSEYLLGTMSEAEYKRGIRKSIPQEIAVSHKFGERTYTDPTTNEVIHEFHDCGIVYYEKYPYLLCMMTKGVADIDRLERVIEDVSAVIYETIVETYP